MHPQFFKLLSSFSSNIKLEIVGRPDPVVVSDAQLVDFEVVFTGFLNDVRTALDRADIFYYPLRENHYGTGELALLEAMSMSLPPVACNNFAESSIINDSSSGFLSNTPLEFVDKLSRLIKDSSLRKSFGTNARNHIIEHNSLWLSRIFFLSHF